MWGALRPRCTRTAPGAPGAITRLLRERHRVGCVLRVLHVGVDAPERPRARGAFRSIGVTRRSAPRRGPVVEDRRRRHGRVPRDRVAPSDQIRRHARRAPRRQQNTPRRRRFTTPARRAESASASSTLLIRRVSPQRAAAGGRRGVGTRVPARPLTRRDAPRAAQTRARGAPPQASSGPSQSESAVDTVYAT